MDIKNQKKELRNKMLRKRALLDPLLKLEYDSWVCEQLEQLITTSNYQSVHAYLPMGDEIDIAPLLESLLAKKITVVTPKTLPKRKLENRVLTSLTDIEKGVYGTTHPANSTEYTGTFDLIIIPGLAYDDDNYRLGYGGGYYDNFIVNHPEAYKIGIFYPELRVENVPIENHDIQLDEVLIKN